MNTVSLSDDGDSFKVALHEATEPSCIVLFSVGSGGNPERHLPLIQTLVEHGCTVVAPHFARLASPRPTSEDLLLRARRLHLSLAMVGLANLPVTGVGHSIGATILVALAGGRIWMGPQEQLQIAPIECLRRLVLMAPATGFFQAPCALDAVNTPLQIWTGTRDSITPPDQSDFLKQKIESRVQVDMRLVEEAGHFTFMNSLPPQIVDTLPERDAFLDVFMAAICNFAVS